MNNEMSRAQKINLLRGIEAGTRSLAELNPEQSHGVWFLIKGMYSGRNIHGERIECAEAEWDTLPGKQKSLHIIHLVDCSGNAPIAD